MTPEQFRDARYALGFTQTELAEAMELGGDGKRTIRRWEHGERPIPGPVRVLMRYFLDDS